MIDKSEEQTNAMDTLQKVRSRLSELENYVSEMMRGGLIRNVESGGAIREKIDRMSDEVVDTNPYSRLMALQKMGIVRDYEHVRDVCVAIVGVGGVGGCAAEMMARCGVGKLILFDYDKVEIANMNRMFYQPIHVGMAKVIAASAQIRIINPDVVVEACNCNISSISDYQFFLDRLKNGGMNGEVDMVLGCVDNYEACNSLQKVWIESGVSETGIDAHIQLIVPGFTACFACVPPLAVASEIDEKSLKREGVCAASLPTTMTLIAGLMVQNALKFLLKFGSVSTCLTYAGASDHFSSFCIKPNPNCSDANCIELQKEKSVRVLASNQMEFQLNFITSNQQLEIKHEQNDWGIEVENSSDEYNKTSANTDVLVDDKSNIDDLRDQFNALATSDRDNNQ